MPKFSEVEYEELLRRVGHPPSGILARPLPTHVLRGSRQPNKTEAEYGLRLEARWRAGEFSERPRYEAITLRLAPACKLTVDWYVRPHEGKPQLHEVKGGHVWEDSLVKLKTVAVLFPIFEFWLARKERGTWTVRRIDAA